MSANPLPVADLFDGILIGEAEERIDALTDTLWDGLDGPREALWEALAQIPGLYAPQLAPAAPAPVARQWVRDLSAHPTETVVHTPDTEFGDMHLIEIARGCGRGCRFCMAGYLMRPKREQPVDAVLAQAARGLAHRDRIGIVGAAVSDYSQIDTLVEQLRAMGARLSVSSLRVDPLSEPLLQALAESGAQTLTLAPEAGSERLRQVVNKGVTEDHLLHAAARADHYRFRQLKLYFMLGLPSEEDDDIRAIAALCRAVDDRFSGRVTANVTPFVPKAHTPFQWSAMAPRETIEARIEALQKALRPAGIEVRGESAAWAELQGVLARGDRRLNEVLLALRGRSLRAWQRAMEACAVRSADYVRARDPAVSLPWAFVRSGVSARFLARERERAARLAPTVPCPPDGCTQCGACEIGQA